MEILQEIGAVAGWAAVVGVVVLWALHLSQARDVKRLRKWAGGKPEQAVIRAPRRSRPSHRRIGTRSVAVAFAGALVVAYGVTRLTADDRPDSSDARASSDDGSTVTPGKVTVTVLNATMVPGLAARLRDRIAAAGFRKGTIDDFSDKELAESVVQYVPGRQAEAKAVGRTVGVSRREPVAADTRALAGGATVIVIAGADTAAAEPATP